MEGVMRMVVMLGLLLVAVLANVVRGKTGIAGFIGGDRGETWLITIGLLAVILVVAGKAVRSRWDGVFIDSNNRISLSRFQLVLWTLLLVSALLTAGLINAMVPADATPLEIRIPPQIWALLGLGAFSAVAAPAISQNRRAGPAGGVLSAESRADASEARVATAVALEREQSLSARPSFTGQLLVKADPSDARWIDMIRGDNEGAGHVDISKVQQLAFTALLIAIYATTLWQKMQGVADINAFPDMDGGFVALLAISHAAYLADKQIGST
jgi:hypothetical protein